MDKKIYKVLAVGGGTAGHIFPLLSVMEELDIIAKEKGISMEIHYVGLKSDYNFPEIKKASFIHSRHIISAGKLNRYFTWNHILQAGRVIKGLAQAESLLKRESFDLIFSKGGYVSVPIALSAGRRKIPIYTHETDSVMGLSNRIVGRYAEKIFTSFPVSNEQLVGQKYEHSGQPIRKEFCNAVKTRNKLDINGQPIKSNKPLVVVIGGSQGSRRINMFVSEIWSQLVPIAQVVHITGRLEYQEMRVMLKKEKMEKEIVLVDYVNDIPSLFAQAELIISRSGGTVFEFACMGKACILIPLSSSAQNHQLKNAEVLKGVGAAVVLDESCMTSSDLLQAILELLNNEEKRKLMQSTIKNFCKPDASSFIAHKIYNRLIQDS